MNNLQNTPKNNSQKVVLISPPDEDYIKVIDEEFIVIDPPLGLAYIAAVLQKNHIDVSIIDANASQYSIDTVVEDVIKRCPEFVGISVFTFLIETCCEIAQKIKVALPETKIIFGGPHIHTQYEEVLRLYSFVDFCVRGEGEYAVLELVNTIKENGDLEKVKGISYRSNGKIINNSEREFIKNLDELPFPARELLPFDKYRGPQSIGGKKHFTTILPSRGCPFDCHYCACHAIWGNQRRRSVENVLEEIEYAHTHFGITTMRFEDDLFTVNKKWAMGICEGMIKRGLNKKITWETNGRVNTLSKDLLIAMKNANCRSIAIGIEFGNQKILDFANKGIKIPQIIETVKLIKSCRLRVKAYFMIGYPTETKETIEDTIRFSQSLDIDYVIFSLVTPFPGTPLYDYVVKNNLITSTNWADYRFGKARTIKLEGISEDELMQLWYRASDEFWYRPRQMVKIFLWHPRYSTQIAIKTIIKNIKNFFRKA